MVEIYKSTGLCPYTGECESYQTIVNSENWIYKALSRLRREGSDRLPREEGGYSEQMLQNRLENLRAVKRRCYGYNGRCLRFWQFEKKKEEDRALMHLMGHLEAKEIVLNNTPQGF